MISPASGIHRPSYNGAPAIQTMNSYDWSLLWDSHGARPTCARALRASLETRL